MFEHTQEYLDAMTDERVLECISTNETYLKNSEQRLAVFVPEAIKRGLAVSAKALELYGEKDGS